MDIGTPPPDIPFQLAGYTDIAPEEFVYARTPQGNWVASAADPAGRVFVIDQAGDLYYDSGNPQVGVYAVRGTGWAVAGWLAGSRAAVHCCAAWAAGLGGAAVCLGGFNTR